MPKDPSGWGHAAPGLQIEGHSTFFAKPPHPPQRNIVITLVDGDTYTATAATPDPKRMRLFTPFELPELSSWVS